MEKWTRRGAIAMAFVIYFIVFALLSIVAGLLLNGSLFVWKGIFS